MDRDRFFAWLDFHRDLVKAAPKGIINTIMDKYEAFTGGYTSAGGFTFKNKAQVSRWLRAYRVKNKLTIKRLTQPYVRRSNYKSNYEDAAPLAAFDVKTEDLYDQKDGLLSESTSEDGQ